MFNERSLSALFEQTPLAKVQRTFIAQGMKRLLNVPLNVLVLLGSQLCQMEWERIRQQESIAFSYECEIWNQGK